MYLLAQLSFKSGSPELTVGLLALLGLAVAAVWAALRWLASGPQVPDPWDAQTAAALADDSARPLCHRCLTENDSNADFCGNCGATIGQYTNWMPYPYIFSLGHTLRIGTAGEFRQSRWLVFGFMLLAAAEYVVFAPVYWFLLLRNLHRKRVRQASAVTGSA